MLFPCDIRDLVSHGEKQNLLGLRELLDWRKRLRRAIWAEGRVEVGVAATKGKMSCGGLGAALRNRQE